MEKSSAEIPFYGLNFQKNCATIPLEDVDNCKILSAFVHKGAKTAESHARGTFDSVMIFFSGAVLPNGGRNGLV